MELSVIIPYCNEMPQVAFTAQALVEELEGFCDYEIILVDNLSDPIVTCKAGEREFPIRSRTYFNSPKGPMNTWLFRTGRIKNFIYDDKKGHWNAKNYGIANSTGKYLFFLDAHCIMKRDSLRKMIRHARYLDTTEPWGGLHAYINYMLDSHSLEYKVQKKTFEYQFCSKQPGHDKPYKVCVMSTCGMMSPRSVFDELGAWHPLFGIYGGGESYINWKQSTCGYHHWIHNEAECWHYAEKRGYSWNYTDFVQNSFIAAYVVGGDKFLNEQAELRKEKDKSALIDQLVANVKKECGAERELIKSKQVETFEQYINRWEANPGTWGNK